jgi:alpha-L-rhamnosidase
MDSVLLNNTLQENWLIQPDSGAQWSHCPVAPLYVLYMNLLGIRPLEPGFNRYEIRPQLADLNDISVTAFTPKGSIGIEAKGTIGNRKITIDVPPQGEGELVLPETEKADLELLPSEVDQKIKRYRLRKGETIKIHLKSI